MYRRILCIGLAFVLTLVFFYGCAGDNAAFIETAKTQNNVEVIPHGEGNFHFSADYEAISSIDKFCNISTYIVVGYFSDDQPNSWNMSRDPNDITHESDYAYIEGLVYQFNVLEILKGDCDETTLGVNIEHGYRFSIGDSGKLYESEVFYEPTPNEIVVLGLNLDNYYYAAAYPFEFTTNAAAPTNAKKMQKTLAAITDAPLSVAGTPIFVEGFNNYNEEILTISGIKEILSCH